jgi:hypothetical protein
VLIVIYFVVLLLWVIEFERIFVNCIKYTELTNIGKQSYKIGPESISTCAAKHFELWNCYFRSSFDMLSPPFVAKNTQNQTAFHAKIPRSIFEFPWKVMCYLLYNANVVINISYFQLKYAEVKSLIRSWRLSKILLYKTLEGKLSVFFFRTVFISSFVSNNFL